MLRDKGDQHYSWCVGCKISCFCLYCVCVFGGGGGLCSKHLKTFKVDTCSGVPDILKSGCSVSLCYITGLLNVSYQTCYSFFVNLFLI